jgi:hypothetical protein
VTRRTRASRPRQTSAARTVASAIASLPGASLGVNPATRRLRAT